MLVTVAATLLFQPVWRRRRRRLAPGLRRAASAATSSCGGSATLEHTLDLEELAAAVAATVREGLGVRGCGSWSRGERRGRGRRRGAVPRASPRALGAGAQRLLDARLRRAHRGRPAGRILGEPARAADRDGALAALGRQAGLLRSATRGSPRSWPTGHASWRPPARIVEAEERAAADRARHPRRRPAGAGRPARADRPGATQLARDQRARRDPRRPARRGPAGAGGPARAGGRHPPVGAQRSRHRRGDRSARCAPAARRDDRVRARSARRPPLPRDGRGRRVLRRLRGSPTR